MKDSFTILLLLVAFGLNFASAQELALNELVLKHQQKEQKQTIALGTHLLLFADDDSTTYKGKLSAVYSDYLVLNCKDSIAYEQFNFIAIISSRERRVATGYFLGGAGSILLGGYYFVGGGLLAGLGDMLSNEEAEKIGSNYLIVGAALITAGTLALGYKGINLFKPTKFNLSTDWQIMK